MGHEPSVACQERHVLTSFIKRKGKGDANQVREVDDLNKRKFDGQLASSAIAFGAKRPAIEKQVRITSLGVGEWCSFLNLRHDENLTWGTISLRNKSILHGLAM